MISLTDLVARIVPVDRGIAAATQDRLDHKTKPRRSLGRLEDLACRIAAMRGTLDPHLSSKAIVVMGADHGVADEGVSAYPQAVTRQMLLTFAAGGAAINVLARQAQARVVVADLGVKERLPAMSNIREWRIGAGTRNFAREPAMSRAQAEAAIAAGATIAEELIRNHVTLIGLGDMGIANTTAASAIVTALTGAAPKTVTGRGTGIDDRGLEHKIEVIERALALHRPNSNDALDVLSKVGGFEIAGLAGVVLAAAAHRVPVLLDGFITGAAALAAVHLAPPAIDYLIASHQSVEVGHRVVLTALGLAPLLDLDLRLGEGSGAALAMPLVDAALAILREMATFESAGVSDSGA
ncbi:MAG TPA: nicotinate-nucleotide--dimethylbenzimidazole phosphoribosyltransferase [Candidatus Kryptonia bacterium]|nr:nicotinate-nucleotide--dimethylbenzimidazole phosphoribosyltransferase [Candidatus Kryptonia bacterium]